MKPPVHYPPGYFTALIRLHDWPPGIAAQLDGTEDEQRVEAGKVARQEAAERGRKTQKKVATGMKSKVNA